MDLRRLKGFIQLCRPANLPTAAADIFAGLAISGLLAPDQITTLGYTNFLLLLVALVGGSKLLYAGGVVLNDVFDAALDRYERPERPIPSGVVPRPHAALFGGVLLLSGILLVYLFNTSSGLIAFVLACSILIYDGIAKNHGFFGPLFMGICRGLNLWLGMYLVGFEEAISFIWIPSCHHAKYYLFNIFNVISTALGLIIKQLKIIFSAKKL